MRMMSEFREFAVKGNAIDLAVGVIIGAAFGKIVTSVVEDLIMPPIGLLAGNLDFSNMYFGLTATTREAASAGVALVEARRIGPVLAYGNFITIAINFMIVAFCVFLLVKGINRLKRKEAAKPAEPAAPNMEEKLLMEIRDAIRAK